MDILQSRRPSGAAAVLEPVPASHSVTIGFWFPLGSGAETDSERGYTHFVEHMLFKGTETRDARTLARQAERAGGYLNAFTEKSTLCLHCTLPADRWADALELLSDMSFRSVFDPAEFDKEKDVIRSEVLAARDDPEEDGLDEFHARVWSGHPLARRVAGEPEDVDRVTRDGLFRYYRDFLVPRNLAVSAAGNFDPALLESALDAALEGLPAGRSIPDVARPDFHPGSWVCPSSAGQVYLVTGFELPPGLSREELAALDVLTCAFGESSSSRLFQNIRESLGLCYSIGSSYASAREYGMFYVTAGCAPSNFPRLWDMIRSELDRLREGGLSGEEAAEAAAHIHGQDTVAADDTETRMRTLARQRMRFGTAESYEDFSDRILEVDLRSVLSAGDKVFRGPPGVLAYGRIGARIRRSLDLTANGG